MGRVRPNLGTPFGADGPWLAALLDAVSDLYDLLDARLPHPAEADGGGPASAVQPVAEPAPDSAPDRVVPVSEPEPARPPEPDDDEKPVREPADETPAESSLPPPPPRSGRGSSEAAWRAWADLAKVRTSPDDRRDDIIDACIRAGVIDAE